MYRCKKFGIVSINGGTNALPGFKTTNLQGIEHMKQTINLYQFRDAFQSIRPDNFSYEGLEALYDYLEEIDSELELDVIALCCDFSQCSLNQFLEAFQVADSDDKDYLFKASDEEKREAISDYIAHNGIFHSFVDGGKEVIFQNF